MSTRNYCIRLSVKLVPLKLPDPPWGGSEHRDYKSTLGAGSRSTLLVSGPRLTWRQSRAAVGFHRGRPTIPRLGLLCRFAESSA